MKKLSFVIFCLSQLVYSQFNPITEYDLLSDCPKYYTNTEIVSSGIFFRKLVIPDSSLYSMPPCLISNIKYLIKGIKLSREELLIGMQGNIYISCAIDSFGIVTNAECSNSRYSFAEKLDSVARLLVFSPAKKADKEVSSTIVLVFQFGLLYTPDRPKEKISEIVLQYGHCNPIAKRITFKSNLEAIYEENTDSCGQYIIDGERISILKKGSINSYSYTRLSYFILSQCFVKWKTFFGEPVTHSREKTISVKIDDKYYSVSVIGNNDPVGFWAIENLIWKLYSGIKWENEK